MNTGLTDSVVGDIVSKLEFSESAVPTARESITSLFKMFNECDCTMVEVHYGM